MTTLFAWQRAILASTLTESVKLAALRIGLDSAQRTGREVVVNADQVAADLVISERTVWRRVTVLVAGQWLRQTARPTYGGVQGRGRRARYRLTHPPESCATFGQRVTDDPTRVVCHDHGTTWHTTLAESSATTRADVADDNPSRVPYQAESCATTTLADGAVLASDGFSSAAAAAGVSLPGPVLILASKIAQHTPLRGLRWDQLGPARTTELLELIEVHGDQPLVDHAIRTCREPYPTFAQAFLPGWAAMPAPGHHLALVKEPPCQKPGHTGTVRHCVQCAAEALAGDA